MTDVQCDYPGCEVIFDPDVTGITKTKIVGKVVTIKHYCCKEHVE